MTPPFATVPEKKPFTNVAKTILFIGFIAGTLDIITANVVYQTNPIRLFQFIASGAVGRDDAFAGGYGTAFLGFVFHYFIAYSWTVLFFFLYPRVRVFSRIPAVWGLLYGVLIWIGMEFVVLRFSQIPQGPFSFLPAVKGAIILMVMVGLPIVLLTHRYYSRKASA